LWHDILAVLAVCPRRHQAGATLAVGKKCVSQFSDGLHVELAQRAAACVGDIACIGVDVLDSVIPQPPKLEQPLLTPHDVLTPCRILWVMRAWQVHAAEGAKILLAVLAVTHARSRPALVNMPSTMYFVIISS